MLSLSSYFLSQLSQSWIITAFSQQENINNIHSFNNYLLSTYSMPGIILGPTELD